MNDEIEYLIIQTTYGTWKVVKKETCGKNYYTWCNLRYFDTKEKAEKYKNNKEGI